MSSYLATRFYVEQLGTTELFSSRVAWFMTQFRADPVVLGSSPWGKAGKARVYFELWSQNRFRAICWLEKVYYDAASDDILADCLLVQRKARLRNVISRPIKSQYAGAKTRDAIREFVRRFDAKKANRD